MKAVGGKGVLALSVLLGVATSYMVYQYVDQAGQMAKPVETTPVVTAARDIPARTALTPDMLRLVQLPVTVKLAQAIATPILATGKVTKLPITQGEQLLANKLFGDREESGLAFVVPPGKRAVSVGVNELLGSGGMIVPGDAVDVVVVFDTETTNEGAGQRFGDVSGKAQIKAIAQYVLQNVEVLAIAQTLQGDPEPQNAAQKLGGGPPAGQPPRQAAIAQPGARTATLGVLPEEAQKLVLAEDKGHLRLVLRSRGDDTIMNLADDGLLSMMRGAAVLKTEPKPL